MNFGAKGATLQPQGNGVMSPYLNQFLHLAKQHVLSNDEARLKAWYSAHGVEHGANMLKALQAFKAAYPLFLMLDPASASVATNLEGTYLSSPVYPATWTPFRERALALHEDQWETLAADWPLLCSCVRVRV